MCVLRCDDRCDGCLPRKSSFLCERVKLPQTVQFTPPTTPKSPPGNVGSPPRCSHSINISTKPKSCHLERLTLHHDPSPHIRNQVSYNTLPVKVAFCFSHADGAPTVCPPRKSLVWIICRSQTAHHIDSVLSKIIR